MNKSIEVKDDVVKRFSEHYSKQMFLDDLERYYKAIKDGLLVHQINREFSKRDKIAICHYAFCKNESSERYQMVFFDMMLEALGFNVYFGYSMTISKVGTMPVYYEILAYMVDSGFISKKEYKEVVAYDVTII